MKSWLTFALVLISNVALAVDPICRGGGTGGGGTDQTLKKNYGHYLAAEYSDSPTTMATECAKPNVMGFYKRANWEQVDNTTGVYHADTGLYVANDPSAYDFSWLDSQLLAIRNSGNPGCHLLLFIEWKSFGGGRPANPCPANMKASDNSDGYAANTYSAFTCKIYDVAVVARWNAMMAALATHTYENFTMDNHPNIEGLQFQESADGYLGTPTGYTARNYVDGLIAMVLGAGAVFHRIHIMSYLNFITGGQSLMVDVEAALKTLPNAQGCIGGPDSLPASNALYKNPTRIYPMMHTFTGCRFISIQNNSYQEEGPAIDVGGDWQDADPGVYHRICDKVGNLDIGASKDHNDTGKTEKQPNGVLDCTMDEIAVFSLGSGSGTFGTFNTANPFNSGLCVNSYLIWNHRTGNSNTGLSYANALPVIKNRPYGPGWFGLCPGGGGVP